MKKLSDLLEQAEQALTTAEKALALVQNDPASSEIDQVLSLVNRANAIDTSLCAFKVKLLTVLASIALAIGKRRYDKVDSAGRDYAIDDIRHGTKGLYIWHTGAFSRKEIERFVAWSRLSAEDSPDFGALCKAILTAAVTYLETVPDQRASQASDTQRLLAELRALLQPLDLK